MFKSFFEFLSLFIVRTCPYHHSQLICIPR
jgi:hypothetical protein